MAGVMIYQRANRDFGLDLARRGHHVVYRTNEANRCPGCGRQQWFVGRITAECGFCGTAVPLAEAQSSGVGLTDAPAARKKKPRGARAEESINWEERREHERIKTENRTLQLLIDGSPHSFAVHNISAGGVMGADPVGLQPGSEVLVRFEGGILVPAVVRWMDGDLTGLAFTSPLMLDTGKAD